MAKPFELVAEREATPEMADGSTLSESSQDDRAAQLFALALKSLSQRALVALASLFTLLTVGSMFWLWLSTPDPDMNQLLSLGMYGLFVLAVNVVVLRRR